MANTYAYSKAESDSKFDKVTAENIETALGYNPANDSNTIHKTGTETIDGSKTFSKPLKIGNQAPLSANQGFFVALLLDDSGTGNGHGIDDNSVINRIGNVAYASFDAKAEMAGENGYDHYNAFQDSAKISTTGLIATRIGFVTQPTINNGTVTNRMAFLAHDISGTGILENNYGLWVKELVRGTESNYAIFTEGTTPSKFEGNVDVKALLISGTDANNGGLTNAAYKHLSNVFAEDQTIRDVKIFAAGADRKISLTSKTRTLWLYGGDGTYDSGGNIRLFGKDNGGTNASGGINYETANSKPHFFFGGNIVVNTTTDNGVDKLQVEGSAKFSGVVTTGSGATRPATGLSAGSQFFDTTLGKPIWYNGSAWVDAMGTVV